MTAGRKSGRRQAPSLLMGFPGQAPNKRRPVLAFPSSRKMQKKKVYPSAQDTFSSIMELLSKIKPHIEGFIRDPTLHSIAPDLDRVAKLAETFAEQRPKSAKGLTHMSDSLDQEAVNLWNISGLIIGCELQAQPRLQIGAVRLAAFRLMQAGLEAKPGIDALLTLLQMASKTGLSLSEGGNNVVAGSVLTSAAKYEEMLRNADDPEGTYRQKIASSTVVYLSSRMEAAWNEGNVTVAEFMSKKIAEEDQRLALLTPQVREYLAIKFANIGRSLLKEAKAQASDAVVWLQRALKLMDKVNDDTGVGVHKAKISILRALALAFFTSGLYDRAEAVLDELIPVLDGSPSKENQEYQELRWLRLSVYKRRKARESALTEALKSIVDHMAWSESNISEVLQELGALKQQHAVIIAIHHHCLQRAMKCTSGETDYIDQFLLSAIFHCSKDDNHNRALKTLEETFSLLSDADVELGDVAVTACITLIWRAGDKFYQLKKWSPAADWYLMGTHQLFRISNPEMTSKCYRKAALCYIEHKEFAKASTVIRRSASNEAATHYVTFLTALHQGLEDEAIHSINEMQQAPGFDRKMLLLATQVSHRSEMRVVLLSVLNHLLKTLKFGCSGEIVVEAMTLLRCMIKLVLGLLVDPTTTNREKLIDAMIEHFRTAKTLTIAAKEQKAVDLIMKDIAWLWRSAYNSAIQGCTEWENCGSQISELFDIAKILLETWCQASPLDIDDESRTYLMTATFSAVSGKVFSARELIAANGMLDELNHRTLYAEIRKARDSIQHIVLEGSQNGDLTSRGESYVHILRVFEVEFCVQLRDWNGVSNVIKEVVNSGPLRVGTYEAIADMLWVNRDCPARVLQECLEAVLLASLDRHTLSVERFSRWLRAMCTILLTRDTHEGRMKAVGFCEQAVGVIEEYDNIGQDEYPIDERQWLLATAFNTATECLHGSRLDEAKRWYEAAMAICRFVPAGNVQAEKISASYTNILARLRKERRLL